MPKKRIIAYWAHNMNRKPSTIKIGVFIFSSVLLIIVSILALSSGNLFSKKADFVVFFNTSLKGLDIGAPVKFNGVRIGTVTDISVAYDADRKAVYTPVVMQINSSMFNKMSTSNTKITDYQSFYDEQIKNGLAAKLTMDSMVTGKVFIELNYFKKNEVGTVKALSNKYQQMPSVNQDFGEIINNIDAVIQKINTVDFADTFKSLGDAGKSIVSVCSDPNIKEILRSLNVTVGNFNNLVLHADDMIEGISSGLNESFDNFGQAMISVKDTSGVIHDMFDPNSDFRTNLDNLVQQMERAFRTIRVFVDYIERNPNSILTGKGL